MNRLVLTAIAFVAFTDAVNLWACVCVGEWPTVEQAIAASPVAFVRRVALQGKPPVRSFYSEQDVGYIDVEVIEVLKGEPRRSVVRIWDGAFTTDCSYDLRPFHAGVLIAVAVEKNSADPAEYWSLLHREPGLGDYVIGGCGH